MDFFEYFMLAQGNFKPGTEETFPVNGPIMTAIAVRQRHSRSSSPKLRFKFPNERPVEDLFGYLAQAGKRHEQAKPLRGFGSGGVLEVVEDWDRSTYRAVYTVRLKGVVLVLHVFQKKSTRGAATPKADIDLIRGRLRVAEQVAKELLR